MTLKAKKGYKFVKGLFGKYEEIPEEWEIKKIDEIGKLSGGGTPDTTNKEYWNGKILWAVPTDITKLQANLIGDTERKITKYGLENSSANLLPSGAILITSRATIGKCVITTKPITTNQGFQSIICGNEYNNLFIFYLIKYNRNILLRLSYGTTFLEISKKEMSKISIPVPNSTPEQQKIASILSRVDALIESTQRIIYGTERLKKGLMQKLLTRGIGHDKFKKVKWLFGKEIKIPEEWKIIRIGDVCFVTKLAGFEYTKYIVYQDVGEVPLIKAQNVQMGKFSNKNIQYISKKISDFLVRSKVGNNDVLMVFIGAGIGNVCHAPSGEWNLAPNVARISPKKINDVYLLFFLQSEIGQKATIFFSTSTAKESISMGEIRKIKITLPSISEQQKIASILSNVDSQIQSQTQYKEKLERLKKSLMQKLLTGQIRVKV